MLDIIKKSKKGVNTAAIMEKTGLKAGHIYNIVSILKKQGKVKGLGKGLYVKSDFEEDCDLKNKIMPVTSGQLPLPPKPVSRSRPTP